MSAKHILRPYFRPIAQWAAISVQSPQQVVIARFCNNGRNLDVTTNHTIASLRPLTLAIGGAEMVGMDGGILTYRDAATGSPLGRLVLEGVATRTIAGNSLSLYEIRGCDHRCVRWPLRPWNAWLQSRAARKHQSAHNFSLGPDAQRQLMVAYICPRPVVLVSVVANDHENIFPMDLIGPLNGDCFTLALRSTSISVSAMCKTGRVALSSVRAGLKSEIYRLGEHHKKTTVDWDGLPFALNKSDLFQFPVVEAALCVREIVLDHFETIGSHCFFVGRVESERRKGQGGQLHHTSGIHQYYRQRLGQPFEIV